MKSLAHVTALALAITLAGCSLLSSDEEPAVLRNPPTIDNGTLERVTVVFATKPEVASVAAFVADNHLILIADAPPPLLYEFAVNRATAPDSVGVGGIVARIRDDYAGIVDEVSGCRTVVELGQIIEHECY